MMASSYRLRRVVVALSVVALTIPLLSGVAEAKPAPKTVIDSAPPAGTTSTSATFTFHSSISPATFTCKLDSTAAGTCASPMSYTALTQGRHTFSVYATASGISDLRPATATWTVDYTPPSTPTGLSGAATSPTSVTLNWTASIDNTGVTGYDVLRDGALLTTVGAVTAYTDATVLASAPHTYAVRARDIAGNVSTASAAVSVNTTSPLDPHLTRAPYLTDLVGLNATVNFATDRSGTSASVRYGSVSGGVCSLTSTSTATRLVISVNGTFEYQWKALLTLPVAGQYCYRVYLNATDLLAANASPQFSSQVPAGSTGSFSFAVFGDWGQVDASGNNPEQTSLMRQIAASGSRFAITVGDNAYPAGSQGNYGDLQQVGADTSAVFGASTWAGVGSSLAMFPSVGNHGLARSDAVHPHFANWPEDAAVTSSNGRYQVDAYCCPNGSTAANYPSAWYAIDAGGARFYVLDAAWADLNTGTGTAYGNEYLSHWAPSSPEYLWLKADLAAHPSGLKFAFFHYPLYSDQPSESSDTYLQGNSSLEGLLASKGVNLAFSGHAHIYQRNAAAGGQGRLSLPSYVTGGGGAQAQSTGTCSSNDKYAIGWSYTTNRGTACGAAAAPTSPAQVYHFLKVTISGSKVTVTPTDSAGRTFDVQTYTFNPLPDTYIDSAPPAGTSSTSATFSFHANSAAATFTCTLDGGTPTACTSPTAYAGLTEGSHTFSVYATVGGVKDPLPATSTWTVDTTPPNAPDGFAATATSPFSVSLSWTAATDNLGVTGYDVFRDGAVLATIAPATGYTDTNVAGGSNHVYAVRARDVAGNVSSSTASISVTTPPPPVPVFANGFESGDLSAWTTSGGLAVQGAAVHGGAFAAEGNTTNGATYAKKTLPSTYSDAYARVWYEVVAGPDQVNLLRLRDATGASLGYLYLADTGQLAFHNDATGTNTLSATAPAPGWHALELRLLVNGPAGAVEVWLDNTRIEDLSTTAVDTGTSPVAQLQIGELQTARTYDVVFDDAAFGTSRLGPAADTTPPSLPTNVTATATTPFSVQVDWTPSTDDSGVAGYDVFRDGTFLANVGTSVATYTDGTVLASTTHQYAVQARDAAGNLSALSAPASATTPPPPIPLFADGFESGDLSAWTSSGGLVVESADVHSGGFAAEGNTTNGGQFAKKTLAATYGDAYARVDFEMKSQVSQMNLLRMRDGAGNSIGYVYLTAGGQLGFHDDATALNTISVTTPGAGWHALELHLGVNGVSSAVEVWLDGTLVADLSGPATLGANPVGTLQIGETQSGQTYDVVFDDAAFGTSRLGPSGDITTPSLPTNVTATPTSPFSVQVDWTASIDDVGVTGYDVFRDGTLFASLGNVTTYTDTTVLSSSTHWYAVRARDAAGNLSTLTAPMSATTPDAAPPLFADGFESGTLGAWTTSAGLTVQGTDVRSGGYAAEGNTTNGNTFARKTLPATYADGYARVAFELKSQAAQVNLLRMRDAAGVSIGYVYLTGTGQLAFHDDTTNLNTVSTMVPGAGWHSVELHLGVNGASSTVEVWLDGVSVTALSGPTTLGIAPIGILQIGETQTGRTYDVVFDEVAFGTQRLGPFDTNPPTAPASLTATATSPFSVDLSWDPAIDNIAVTGYDVFRNGVPLASLAAVTTFTDYTASASTAYTYTVKARDGVGNTSTPSADAAVTTPAAPVPVFADGFESGTLGAWTTSAGLTVQGTDVRSGGYAAEGNTTNGNTFARKTLPATYADGYARVAFELKSQAAQVNLLRMRDAAGVSIGYVYLTGTGQLAFHDDTTNLNTVSTMVPGAGWHSVELHLGVNGASSTVEVWLDGVSVTALSGPTTLGTAPIGILQIGETQTGRTYDVVFDDAAFGDQRVGQ